jgi:hypothetical protein
MRKLGGGGICSRKLGCFYLKKNTQQLKSSPSIFRVTVWGRKSCDTGNYWVFGLCPSSVIVKSTAFRKLICFRPYMRGWETPTQSVPLERANLSHWTVRISDDGRRPKPNNPNDMWDAEGKLGTNCKLEDNIKVDYNVIVCVRTGVTAELWFVCLTSVNTLTKLRIAWKLNFLARCITFQHFQRNSQTQQLALFTGDIVLEQIHDSKLHWSQKIICRGDFIVWHSFKTFFFYYYCGIRK